MPWLADVGFGGDGLLEPSECGRDSAPAREPAREAVREQLIALGVRVVGDLDGSASAGGRWCYFRDAEGNVFDLKEWSLPCLRGSA